MKRKAEPDAEEMTSSKGPSTSKKLAPDATNDFINETELQKSIQVSVLKTADAVAQVVREGGGGQVQFHPDVVAQVSALIWDTVSDDWTSDLLAFSSHGGRQAVNVSDVALIMRRNKHLLEIVSKAADIDLGDYERPTTKRQRSSNKESTRGRRGARSGTSRASTAMDGPGLRSGTLTPRSDQDANSRLSAVEEVKREAVLEQKATATIKTVDEEDFDDDDVMIVDAPAERPPLIEKGNSFEEDDFSMLDIDPAAATVSKPTVQNETPRRSARNALRATIGQGVDPRAENSTPRKNLQKSLVAKNLPSEKKNSPARAKRSPRKKTPSPDLFNTPVKENNSDEFDDLFEIPDQQQVGKGQSRQPSPKSAKNDVGAAPGKSERGWSVKFSEFSFFDDDLEVDQPSGEKGKAVQQPHDLGKPTTSAPPSRSKAMTSSVTPKSSLVTKSKLTRSGVKSSKQKNSAAALRSQEKQPLTTPKRTDALKSRLKDSAKKLVFFLHSKKEFQSHLRQLWTISTRMKNSLVSNLATLLMIFACFEFFIPSLQITLTIHVWPFFLLMVEMF